MKNFYDLFAYTSRSLGVEEIFHNCRLATGREVAYIVLNLETGKGYIVEDADPTKLKKEHFTLQVTWSFG